MALAPTEETPEPNALMPFPFPSVATVELGITSEVEAEVEAEIELEVSLEPELEVSLEPEPEVESELSGPQYSFKLHWYLFVVDCMSAQA